jgi:hypothetical protein
VTLAVDQLALGDRVLDLAVRDAAGQPIALRGARLQFTMPDMTTGSVVVEAHRLMLAAFKPAVSSFPCPAAGWSKPPCSAMALLLGQSSVRSR